MNLSCDLNGWSGTVSFLPSGDIVVEIHFRRFVKMDILIGNNQHSPAYLFVILYI